MTEHIRFIANKFSGTSDKSNLKEIIQRKLDLSKFSYELKYTDGSGHALALSQESAKEGIPIVASVGGDGTVNEVAKGLMGSNTTLAVIPGGSGNGFAMHIGMGRDIPKAITLINESLKHPIDTCQVNDHFFINVAGVGFDGIISHRIKQSVHRGLQLYLKETIKSIRQLKSFRMKIETDHGVIEDEFIQAVAANASMYGYHFSIAPKARLSDGHFDLITIKKASLLRYLLDTPKFINKSLDKSPVVDMIKTKKLKITTDKLIPHYQIDGEHLEGSKEYIFKMNPNSLNVLIPKNVNKF